MWAARVGLARLPIASAIWALTLWGVARRRCRRSVQVAHAWRICLSLMENELRRCVRTRAIEGMPFAAGRAAGRRSLGPCVLRQTDGVPSERGQLARAFWFGLVWFGPAPPHDPIPSASIHSYMQPNSRINTPQSSAQHRNNTRPNGRTPTWLTRTHARTHLHVRSACKWCQRARFCGLVL